MLPRNQQSSGFDRVVIDYDFSTVPGTPAYARTAEPRPVAGYGTPQIVPGEGLYLDSVVWTPHGVLNAGGYQDLQLAARFDSRGRIVHVTSAALSNKEDLFGLGVERFAATPAAPAVPDAWIAPVRGALDRIIGGLEAGDLTPEDALAWVESEARQLPGMFKLMDVGALAALFEAGMGQAVVGTVEKAVRNKEVARG